MIAWVTRSPRTVIALFTAITIFLGWFAAQVRIESSIESTLPAGSPQVRFYDSIRSTFGSDEIGVIGLRCEDLFSAETLTKIQRITRAVEKIEGVEKVLSLTNAVDASQDAYRPPPLIVQIPPTAEQRAHLVELLADTPLYGINLVAPDLRGTAINVFFENLSDVEYVDLGIDQQIRAILDAENDSGNPFYTGSSHIKQEATASMRHDLYVFTPTALLLVLGTLWLSFRRLRAVVAPMITVLVALVWTLGFMVLAGKSINLGTFVLPPLLLVIGSSYAIHVLSQYYECLALVQKNRTAEEGTTKGTYATTRPTAFLLATRTIRYIRPVPRPQDLDRLRQFQAVLNSHPHPPISRIVRCVGYSLATPDAVERWCLVKSRPRLRESPFAGRRGSRIQLVSRARRARDGPARTCPWRFASSTTPSRPTKRSPSRWATSRPRFSSISTRSARNSSATASASASPKSRSISS